MGLGEGEENYAQLDLPERLSASPLNYPGTIYGAELQLLKVLIHSVLTRKSVPPWVSGSVLPAHPSDVLQSGSWYQTSRVNQTSFRICTRDVLYFLINGRSS